MPYRSVLGKKKPFLIEKLECRVLLSVTTLPVTGAQAAIFDNARNLIYIPTSSGTVERYDIAAKTMLAPWTIGGSLGPGDITADGSALFLTERQFNGTNDTVHKIDLTTGQTTNIVYPKLQYEGASWDLVIGSDGNAYVTADAGTSQTTYSVAIINTTTNAVSRSPVLSLEYRTMLGRSEDRNYLAIGYTTSGLETYSVATGTILAKGTETDTVGASLIPMANADGSLFATQTFGNGLQIVTKDLSAVRNFNFINTAFAFDPARNQFYVAPAGAGVLTAYDTNTWNALYTLSGVTAVNGGGGPLGSMSINSAGTEAAVVSADGKTVQLVDLPISDGIAAQAFISNLTTYGIAGRTQSFTLTVKDAGGNIATGYRGTVQLTSSDVRASFPPAYTFTAADAGVHTFTTTFRSTGTQQLQASDTAGNFTASASITLHALNARLDIPVVVQSGLFDPTRNLFYFATANGTIERYDPNAQQLLTPIVIGNPINGMDITPDGSRLFVGIDYRSVTQGWIDEVDLATGTFKQDTYSFPAFGELQGGSYDVVIPSSNIVLFSSDFNGSGSVPLRQLDLTTGAITVRTDFGSIEQDTSFVRGGDRSIVFISEPNSSAYPYGVYDAKTNTFPIRSSSPSSPFYVGSINHNGTLLSSSKGIVDASLQPVNSNGVTGGIFDPVRDILYQFQNTLVSVYNTTNWTLMSQFPISAPAVYGVGLSDDGKWMVLPSATATSIYPLITRPVITSSATSIVPGATETVVVAAQKPDGTTDASYRGMIHFDSTDAAAGLPADYTFTAADAGQHTFNIPLNTPGRQSITVTDTATGMPSLLSEILVTGQNLDSGGALSVIGSSAADTVNLSTSAGVLTATLNGVTRTYTAAQINRVEVLMQGGNDNITVGAGGIPGGTIEAGAGFDTLNVTAGDDLLRALSIDGGDDADQGIITATGAQQVNFTGGAGSDTFNYTATTGNDTLAVTPSLISGTRSATFSAERVTVSGGAGDDNLSGDKLIDPTLYTLDGGDGNDTLTSAHGGGSNGTVRVSLQGGNDNDTFDVPSPNTITDTSKNYASIIGGAGTDLVRETGTILVTFNGFSNNGNSVSYATIEQIALSGTSAAENFDVDLGNSSTISLTANAGDGADTFTLGPNPSSPMPTLNGEGGNDTLTVSVGTTGRFAFDGGADSDSVVFNSSTSASHYTVNDTEIHDSRHVFDSNVEAISLNGGTGSDIFDITPRAGAAISISGSSPTPPTSPGDQLNITAGGATDLTLIPGATGAGQVTSSNRKTVTYSGIETVPDVFPPRVISSAFDPAGSTQMTIAVTFSEDVGTTVTKSSLQLQNSSAQIVSLANATFAYANATATWTFPSNALLPDDNYSAIISASGIHDTVPNAMQSDYTFSFYVLAADGDGNRTVAIEDFNILAANFGKSGQTFAQGNYDYSSDGVVSITDFNILAANFGKHLDAPTLPQSLGSQVPGTVVQATSFGEPDDQRWVDQVL